MSQTQRAKSVLTMLAVSLIAITASAQTTTSRATVQKPAATTYSSKGIRLALIKPMLQVEYNESWLTRRGRTRTDNSVETMTATGLSVGYVYLPLRSLGGTVNLAMMDVQKPEPSSLTRLDGNLAFAFNEYFNLKGGLNVSKFTSGHYSSQLNAGIGMQAGVGIQITRNFGLDLGYVHMEKSGRIEDVNVVSKKYGYEIALTGTF